MTERECKGGPYHGDKIVCTKDEERQQFFNVDRLRVGYRQVGRYVLRGGAWLWGGWHDRVDVERGTARWSS